MLALAAAAIAAISSLRPTQGNTPEEIMQVTLKLQSRVYSQVRAADAGTPHRADPDWKSFFSAVAPLTPNNRRIAAAGIMMRMSELGAAPNHAWLKAVWSKRTLWNKVQWQLESVMDRALSALLRGSLALLLGFPLAYIGVNLAAALLPVLTGKSGAS